MSLRIGYEGDVQPVMFPGSVQRDFDGNGIALVDRRDGLLLSRLGFSEGGRGTSAVFFDEKKTGGIHLPSENSRVRTPVLG